MSYIKAKMHQIRFRLGLRELSDSYYAYCKMSF